MTLKRVTATLTLALTAVVGMAQSIIPIEAWTVDLSKPSAKSIYITRGESVNIRPTVTYNGAWVFPASGVDVVMNYKSSDMTNTYYVATGSVHSATGGVLNVPWTVAQESTAKAYSFEIKAATGTVASIRITGTIFLRDSLTTLSSTTTPVAMTQIDWLTVSNLNTASGPWNSSAVDVSARSRLTVVEASTSNWDAAYAHTTESSNTVHGGFIKTAYDWATNAYAYAGLAWHQATNALAVAQAEGIFTAWLGTNTYVKVEADTLQSVVTRSGTVTEGDVTIDAANERANTYGGSIVNLGARLQQPECIASGGAGAIALGFLSVASGNSGATALGYGTIASGDNGATALGEATEASGNDGATALGYATTASGNSGATALGSGTLASGYHGATALGESTTASGNNGATALGLFTTASGNNGATALGENTTASGNSGATALGFSSIASNDSSFAWGSSETPYGSHGIGSFNINPIGGLSGFWIGETNFAAFLDLYVPKALTNDWEVGSHESFLTTNGSGSGLTGITAAQVGAVPTSRTITVNGQVGTLDSNVVFTVMGSFTNSTLGWFDGSLNGSNGVYVTKLGTNYWITFP